MKSIPARDEPQLNALHRWLSRRFAPKIVIDVEPGRLRARADGREHAVPVDPALFGGARADGSTAYEHLAALLRTLLLDIVNERRVKLRPHVTWRGAERLDPALVQHQGYLIEEATLDAGAQTVEFDPPLPPDTAS